MRAISIPRRSRSDHRRWPHPPPPRPQKRSRSERCFTASRAGPNTASAGSGVVAPPLQPLHLRSPRLRSQDSWPPRRRSTLKQRTSQCRGRRARWSRSPARTSRRARATATRRTSIPTPALISSVRGIHRSLPFPPASFTSGMAPASRASSLPERVVDSAPTPRSTRATSLTCTGTLTGSLSPTALRWYRGPSLAMREPAAAPRGSTCISRFGSRGGRPIHVRSFLRDIHRHTTRQETDAGAWPRRDVFARR